MIGSGFFLQSPVLTIFFKKYSRPPPPPIKANGRSHTTTKSFLSSYKQSLVTVLIPLIGYDVRMDERGGGGGGGGCGRMQIAVTCFFFRLETTSK